MCVCAKATKVIKATKGGDVSERSRLWITSRPMPYTPPHAWLVRQG